MGGVGFWGGFTPTLTLPLRGREFWGWGGRFGMGGIGEIVGDGVGAGVGGGGEIFDLLAPP